MAYNMSIPSPPDTQTRAYQNLAGLDYAHLPSMVDTSHSPDAMNVYKDYSSTAGQAIETRPGILKLGETTDKIYGLHRLDDEVFIHSGPYLYKWAFYPAPFDMSNAGDLIQITDELNTAKSTSFIFDEKLYILDGLSYFVYDGSTFNRVTGTIPTTRINADPDGGNGTLYQDINLLSNYRKNTFVGDGNSTVFYLDSVNINNETPTVIVNGESVNVESFNSSEGTVTLSEAPTSPLTAGEANVIITFRKDIDPTPITSCTIATVYDNRVFFSGGNKKGYIYHSELEDVSYFSEESFYDDGNDNIDVKSLIVANGTLVVIKDYKNTQLTKVFYHTPSIDYEYGKIYPTTTTEITLGAKTRGINFYDDIVYLSPKGLESITLGTSQMSVYHKSSAIDRDFINETGYDESDMAVWNGYLCVLCQDKMFLADSRAVNKLFGTYQYEWFVWNGLSIQTQNSITQKAKMLFVDNDSLYFVTDNCICLFSGTNDNGNAITAYWCMPQDVFQAPAYLKTTQKRGAMAWIKGIPNSRIKIACITDRDGETLLATKATSGFNFEDINFDNFSFGNTLQNMVFFNAKKKKILYFQLKFYSDELNTPFGLYSSVCEYIIKKYAK